MMNIEEFRTYVTDQGLAVHLSAKEARNLIEDIDAQLASASKVGSSIETRFKPGNVVTLKNLQCPTMIVNDVTVHSSDVIIVQCKYWCDKDRKFVTESFHENVLELFEVIVHPTILL